MKVVRTGEELAKELLAFQSENKSVGFIPTMGALHKGHLSLVKLSKEENEITVVSVFVNPTQFNDPKDLEKYPRVPEKDAALLDSAGVDLVFMPDVEEVYPDGNSNEYCLGGLEKPMEGRFRPGHFQGVADVVTRLFRLVKPDNAYFGEKDFQQLKIIQFVTKDIGLPVVVKSGSIIRESDGLAMSSRNMRLSDEQRKIAPKIYEIMSDFDFGRFVDDPQKAVSIMEKMINDFEHLKTEYVSIVDDETMEAPDKLLSGRDYRLCIAVWCGDVRLIDNLKFVISNNC